jgi:hypothetical protein
LPQKLRNRSCAAKLYSLLAKPLLARQAGDLTQRITTLDKQAILLSFVQALIHSIDNMGEIISDKTGGRHPSTQLGQETP